MNSCSRCGALNEATARVCYNCQAPLTPTGGYQPIQPNYAQPPATGNWQAMGADKKIAAGLCGILLGGFGIHKFILGYKTEGLIMLLVTLLTCGMAGFITGIIGLVEGVIYLTKSDEDFVRTYIQGQKGWF
jgi:TM2 domain-containing membrane protein YozV